jgi:hypothetical protein
VGQDAKAKPGHYTGTTSEQGTVAFSVAAGAKRVNGFTTSDGYNRKCQFAGGVGGLGNFTVKVPSMAVTRNGSFSGTAKETLGPFTGTFKVTGKLNATGAQGTVTKVGATCGTSASNPTSPDYLETFTAKHT